MYEIRDHLSVLKRDTFMTVFLAHLSTLLKSVNNVKKIIFEAHFKSCLALKWPLIFQVT